jgi:hypothetical protein
MPRPFSPITPTTIFSFGDPSNAKRGPIPRDAANAPTPAAEALFRKSLRSSDSFVIGAPNGYKRRISLYAVHFTGGGSRYPQ